MADPQRLLAAALLVVVAATLIWFVRGDIADYRRFKRMTDTASRQARYRIWSLKLWLAFALPALVGLALLGRLAAVATLPPEFAAVAAAWLPSVDAGAAQSMAGGAVIGAGIGGLAVGTIFAVRRRRGAATLPQVGDIAALLPRNRSELAPAALLSISAGLTEELSFRLFLPLLLVLVTGSAPVAFVAAAGVFGAMHLYQGWVGVVGTTCRRAGADRGLSCLG